jgi:hypothetical protein
VGATSTASYGRGGLPEGGGGGEPMEKEDHGRRRSEAGQNDDGHVSRKMKNEGSRARPMP